MTVIDDLGAATRLREDRAKVYAEAQGVIEACERDTRDPSAEDRDKLDKLLSRVDELDKDISSREKLASLSPALERGAADVTGGEPDEDGKRVFRKFGRQEKRAWDSPEYFEAFERHVRDGVSSSELRTLTVGTNSAGGYTVPTEMQTNIITFARDFGVMRQLATVVNTADGNPMNWPSWTTNVVSAWTAEGVGFNETDPALGTFALGAYKATHLVKISEELLQDTVVDLQGLLEQNIGEAIAVLENNAFVVGNGTGKPTGFTTQATTGVTGANGQTLTVTADDLVNLKYSVKAAYRRNGTWLVNDATVAKVALLKDTTGQYLWRPGLVANEPDTLLGRPLQTDPDMPVMAVSAKSIAFGDFKRAYIIRDAGSIGVQRLNELYSANGLVGFRCFQRVDGKMADVNAVKVYVNSAT